MKKGGPGQLFTPFGITLSVLLAAVGIALWLAYLPWRWERTKEALRNRFPGVMRMDSEGLKNLLSNTDESKPVLVDVRPLADYEFSHLPRALHMDVSGSPATLGLPEKTDESLVIYDAVGADAFPVADSLKHRYPHVHVLEGGIFEWANRGLPLEGSSGATGKVQPGNSKFAGLLRHRATAQ